MTGLPHRSLAALEPVRRALRDAAEREAAVIFGASADQVRAVLDAAQRDAQDLRQAAAAEGEALARSAAAARSARVRREAHQTVLAEQEALRVHLVRRLEEAATARRSDPRYPRLVERLTAYGRAALGPGATVTESPTGGVVAEKDSRRLDLTLPVLATQALEPRWQEARDLWTQS